LTWDATLYRAVYVDYASAPLVPRSVVARFHTRAGTTIYLAQSLETAEREVTFRWSADLSSYVLVEVRARLHRVIDLTMPSEQAKYDVTPDELTAPDYTVCQALAEKLRAEGWEAAWTLSAADRPDGRQLVVFVDLLDAASSLEVVSVRALGPHRHKASGHA
jgi:RES domain-containing protein